MIQLQYRFVNGMFAGYIPYQREETNKPGFMLGAVLSPQLFLNALRMHETLLNIPS